MAKRRPYRMAEVRSASRSIVSLRNGLRDLEVVALEDEGEEVAAVVRRPHLRALKPTLKRGVRHRLEPHPEDCVRKEFLLEAVLCAGRQLGDQERRRAESAEPFEEFERLSPTVLEL